MNGTARQIVQRAVDARRRDKLWVEDSPRPTGAFNLADAALTEAGGDPLLALDIAASAYVAVRAQKLVSSKAAG